jgi:hypothetical protein
MYADDNRDRIKGFDRQLRKIATHDLLDVEDLADTFGVIRASLDAAERLAVANLRARGCSWTEIGRGLGITRQAAFKRFGQQFAVYPEVSVPVAV